MNTNLEIQSSPIWIKYHLSSGAFSCSGWLASTIVSTCWMTNKISICNSSPRLFFWILQDRIVRFPREDCPPFIFWFGQSRVCLWTDSTYHRRIVRIPLRTVRWFHAAGLTIAPMTVYRFIRCPSGPSAASGRTIHLTRTFSAEPLTKILDLMWTVHLIPADRPL